MRAVTPTARTGTACWQALGTYVHVQTGDDRDLAAACRIAEDVLAEVDRTCSRFRDDTDLVRANGRPGRWTDVDPLLVAAVRVAVEAAAVTDGLVDPCLGRTMSLIGYDADLHVVRRRRTHPVPAVVPSTRDRWREIRTDPAGALRVPEGCTLDLGATAKAWASDLLAASIVEELDCHALVSLGGDVRVEGPSDVPGPAWTVRVTEQPGDPGGEIVPLAGGGVATSSTLARRWRTGTATAHHVVDPRTGRPTDEHWRTVTAYGATCAAANTASTAALVLGPEAVPWLDRHSVAARLVSRDGQVTTTGPWPTHPLGRTR